MSWYASVISGIWGLIMFAPVLPAYIGGPLALLTFILLLTLVLQAAKKISLEW